MAGYDDRDDRFRDRDKDAGRPRRDRDDFDDRDRDDDEGEVRDRGRSRALRQVKGPAIGMLVGGILFILGGIYNLVSMLLQKDEFVKGFQIGFQGGRGRPQAAPDAEAFFGIVIVLTIVFTILSTVFGGLIIFGALQMKKLKSYGLVMTACILGMLPCSWCCVVSLPMGIWSLVTINNSEVKPYFR